LADIVTVCVLKSFAIANDANDGRAAKVMTDVMRNSWFIDDILLGIRHYCAWFADPVVSQWCEWATPGLATGTNPAVRHFPLCS
jgi:hypothetical protein